jgi:hypothetical protein
MPSIAMFVVKMPSLNAASPWPWSKQRGRVRRLPFATLFLCLFSAAGMAAPPASILPDGVFATGDGCTMLAQAGAADDIDATDFFVLSNGELTGMDLACRFTDAEPKGGLDGKGWVVKASCESGAPAVPAVFTIEDAGGGLLHITMKSEGDTDDLGEFVPCKSVAE